MKFHNRIRKYCKNNLMLFFSNFILDFYYVISHQNHDFKIKNLKNCSI